MSDTIGDIKYNNIKKPNVTTGFPLSKYNYEYDENGNLIQPEPLINAVDIDWGGAELHGLDNLDTTSQLLKYISDIHRTGGGSGSQEIIDKDSVVDVMLSAIRALQAEVIKLRNSLVYGVYSYTGKQTAMSEVIDDYGVEDINAEEPLWAVDETNLSELISVDLSSATYFDHQENIKLDTENGALTFIDKASWTDSQNLISKNTDPKLLVYLTTNGLKVTFNLVDLADSENKLSIRLDKLVNSNENNLYNILFILATSTEYKKNNSTILAGDNFCWIQVGHFIYDGIQQGYYNKNVGEFGTLQENEITFGNTRYILNSIDFEDLTLTKFNIYSKYQDFSNEVEAINPNENDRYRVAHITIRSIDTYEDLVEIKDQLPENELIYVEKTNALYIKNEYKLKKLGVGGQDSGGNTPGGDDNPEDIETMTNKELIETLKKMGIVYEHYSENPDDENNYNLDLAALSSVTFIHEASGKKFDISVDAYGKLKSVEQGDVETLKERLGETTLADLMNKKSVRGFVANVRAKEENKNAGDSSDFKLLADRVKIGAIYAPLDSQEVHGCSHAYVELDNTSEKDFPLDDCYLHYCKWNSKTSAYDVYHLELDGYIPAGGTYLVRGKKYVTAEEDANVFIHVDSYDKEWWITKTIVENDQEKQVKELIDFTMNDEIGTQTHSWSFALTYKNPDILETTPLYEAGTNDNTPSGETKDKYVYIPGFIDSVSINNNTQCVWAGAAFTQNKNCIYKNTFELDPAKQAFNALHSKDSSRVRWQNAATDFQYVMLNKDIIEFPHSDLVKPVSDYTPKASFEGKNVCTDKTKFNIEKPNMPTVSFGMDAFKTRCFNWISGGQFDEYVFIKQDNGTWKEFESYKQRDLTDNIDVVYNEYVAKTNNAETKYPIRKEYSYDVCNIGFCGLNYRNNVLSPGKRITSKFPASNIFYTSHKCVIDILSDTEINALTEPKTYTYVVGRADKTGKAPDFEHCSKEMHFTMYPKSYTPRVYQTTDQQGFHWIEYQVWAACAIKLNEVIENDIKEYRQYTQQEVNEFNSNLEGAISTNMINPNSGVNYTESEAIAFNSKLDGAISTNMINPDTQVNYTESEAIEFNSKLNGAVSTNMINPITQVNYTESEVNEFNSKLDGAISTNDYNTFYKGIIPVLINTGDMTQSGARINEWIDYYQAGECLFDHLEQMNIVGNNDLCGTDVTALGTGDDPGKSNGYFYYISYCYDIPNNREIDVDNEIYNIAPIVNNTIIPSLYYFDFACTNQTYRMCMINSEITLVNCKDWFGLAYGSNYTANIYTGFTVRNKFEEGMTVEQTYVANDLHYTPIYTILYYMLNCQKEQDNIKYLVYCHEMPFTVITHANIAPGKCGIPRSVNGNNGSGSSMVGSKLNHIVWYENKANGCPKGLHWFSRLLEYKGIKLCIGGHKHTYCVTYPLREYYQYNNTDSKQSGPMTMTPSLENDNIEFVWKETITYNDTAIVNDKSVDHTKFPLTYRDNVGVTNDASILYPYTYIDDDYSNHAVIYFMCQATGYKLTSNKELPTAQQKFTRVLPKTNNVTEKPHNDQKYSMFTVYELSPNNVKIKLGRIHEVFNDLAHTFTQLSYSSKSMYISYMKRDEAADDYGKWMTETALNNANKDFYIFNNPINW